MSETTIAAISTAYGEAGIGIVRMSGPDSLDVLKKIFVPGGYGKDRTGDGGVATSKQLQEDALSVDPQVRTGRILSLIHI